MGVGGMKRARAEGAHFTRRTVPQRTTRRRDGRVQRYTGGRGTVRLEVCDALPWAAKYLSDRLHLLRV
eukprot:4643698-Prymnesium_polylepis.2